MKNGLRTVASFCRYGRMEERRMGIAQPVRLFIRNIPVYKQNIAARFGDGMESMEEAIAEPILRLSKAEWP